MEEAAFVLDLTRLQALKPPEDQGCSTLATSVHACPCTVNVRHSLPLSVCVSAATCMYVYPAAPTILLHNLHLGY